MVVVEFDDAPRAAVRDVALWAKLRADAIFYLIIAAYVAFALALGQIFHQGGVDSLGIYIPFWFVPAICVAVVLTLFWIFAKLMLTRPGQESAALHLQLKADFLNLLCGVMLFYAYCLFMGAFTLVKTCLPLIRPFYFDPYLAEADHSVHLGHDPWDLLQPILNGAPAWWLQLCYYLVWSVIIGSSPLLAAISRIDKQLRAQFLLAFLLGWIVSGSVLACLFMSGGPVFYGRLTGDVHRYATMNAYLSPHIMPVADRLWGEYQRRQVAFGSGISDFPSLHVTMITLVTLFAWRLRPALGVAVCAFAVLIAITSVELGWHYAVGDYVTVLVAFGLWRASGAMVRSVFWRRIVQGRPGLHGPCASGLT